MLDGYRYQVLSGYNIVLFELFKRRTTKTVAKFLRQTITYPLS